MLADHDQVLVTLADRKFLDQARQLFASAYWQAGWTGDFLLLAYDVPESELAWFRQKGILVYHCTPLSDKGVGESNHPAVVLAKFYLFTPYFRRWPRVVFLDADIIVRASLDRLARGGRFKAPYALGIDFRGEFSHKDKALWAELNKSYKLDGPAFNSGIFAFDTDLITDRTFADLLALYEKFGSLNKYGEEATFNLAFHQEWSRLPVVFNAYPNYLSAIYHLNLDRWRAIIIHFVDSIKPWDPASPYAAEWQDNWRRADAMDLAQRPAAREVWTTGQILFYSRWFQVVKFCKSVILGLDWGVGQIGRLIKKVAPDFYESIRFKKNAS